MVLLLACAKPLPTPDTQVEPGTETGLLAGDSGGDSGGDSATPAPTPMPLEVTSLGVGGVALRHGDTLVLTAPMYTNPTLVEVTLGDVVSDPDEVDAWLQDEDVVGAQAILIGHAHYDHLLDAPRVQERSGGATIYGNVSTRNLLSGLDVVVVNDPDAPLVDRSMCAVPDPCTGVPAGSEGSWIEGDGFRLRALCSTHPAQFLGIIHFGEGCVEETWDRPPTSAGDWLEGATVSWLVDFLDDDGAIAHRVYYQDAPTNAPRGLVHPDLLAERPIDLAVLNVGSWDAVRDHPTQALQNLDPRYAMGVHWENFFQTQAIDLEPIPFHASPEKFDAAAYALLSDRYWRPSPGDRVELEPEEPSPVRTRAEGETEYAGHAVSLRSSQAAWVEECASGCDDVDGDGLVDAWEDLVLRRLRPLLTFDESEQLMHDEEAVLFGVGRVTPVGDRVRVFLMTGYTSDYGRCGVSAHDGDSERVALDLEVSGGDAHVVATYTAAHEGEVTDHSQVFREAELAEASFVEGEHGPRWQVFASDNKHAAYQTVQLCEDAEWLVCLEEDCAPDGVEDQAAHSRLPPVVNVGEPDAPRMSGLEAIGFPDEDAWADQEFCGGLGRGSGCSSPVREKLEDDPFE